MYGTLTNICPNKITQFCRLLYISPMVRIFLWFSFPIAFSYGFPIIFQKIFPVFLFGRCGSGSAKKSWTSRRSSAKPRRQKPRQKPSPGGVSGEPWWNGRRNGKTTGKAWENRRIMVVLMGIYGMYPLVNCEIIMERVTIFTGKADYTWPFSIAMLNYRRVV